MQITSVFWFTPTAWIPNSTFVQNHEIAPPAYFEYIEKETNRTISVCLYKRLNLLYFFSKDPNTYIFKLTQAKGKYFLSF